MHLFHGSIPILTIGLCFIIMFTYPGCYVPIYIGTAIVCSIEHMVNKNGLESILVLIHKNYYALDVFVLEPIKQI